MPWRLSHTSIEAAIGRRIVFLLDENLSPNISRTIRALGYEAIDVPTQSSDGRRILLTQSRERLDDNTWSANIVLLPEVVDVTLLDAVAHALSMLWNNPDSNERLRIAVNNDGRLTVTAAQQKTHYKLRRTGPPLVWIAKPKKSGSSLNLNC